jgi:uncharacterized protein YaeQ
MSKPTIYKAHLYIADMDRNLYADHHLTLARHPLETDERLMVRLLAFALQVPVDTLQGKLELGQSLWLKDQPDLWQKDLTGHVVQWIEIGQPDLKRLTKMCPRCDQVSVYDYQETTQQWWQLLKDKLSRSANLSVWQIAPQAASALTGLLQRTMQLRFTVQERDIWVGDEKNSVDLQLISLNEAVTTS